MKELRKLLFWASVGLLAMLLVFVFASCKSPQPTLSVNREVKDNTEEQVSKVSTDSLTASISKDVKRLYDKVSDLEIESKKQNGPLLIQQVGNSRLKPLKQPLAIRSMKRNRLIKVLR